MPASRPRLALLLILGACAFAAFSLPLRRSFANVAFPTERWDGVFRSDDSHRGGSLTVRFDFRIDTASGVRTAGSDTLLAHVTLAPGMTGAVIAADAKDPEHLRHSDAPEVLHATIVLGARGRMGGELEPYIDPECDCVVVTGSRVSSSAPPPKGCTRRGGLACNEAAAGAFGATSLPSSEDA